MTFCICSFADVFSVRGMQQRLMRLNDSIRDSFGHRTQIWVFNQLGTRSKMDPLSGSIPVKLNFVCELGAVKGFSHLTDRPSSHCDWHKWVGTKESLWSTHTHSSLHSPFALPAVSLFSPTASPQLWIYIKQPTKHTHTHANTPTGRRVLGGFRTWLQQNPLFLPAGCSLLYCLTYCTVGGTMLFTNDSSVSHHCTQPQHMSLCLLRIIHCSGFSKYFPCICLSCLRVLPNRCLLFFFSSCLLSLFAQTPLYPCHTLLPQCPPFSWQIPCAQSLASPFNLLTTKLCPYPPTPHCLLFI